MQAGSFTKESLPVKHMCRKRTHVSSREDPKTEMKIAPLPTAAHPGQRGQDMTFGRAGAWLLCPPSAPAHAAPACHSQAPALSAILRLGYLAAPSSQRLHPQLLSSPSLCVQPMVSLDKT